MTHLRRSAGDRVEHLEGRNELAGRMNLDYEPAGGHGLQHLRETLGGRAQRREVLRPGGDELPLDGGPLDHRAAVRFRFGGATEHKGQQHAEGG